ncbi:transposase [Thiotrichales bacterium HSG14]|nr:transposase [Thiotrichales bacterium HSG14]
MGKVERAVLDNAYFSNDNVNALLEEDIATGHQNHNQSLEERLAEPPADISKNATPVEEMQHRLKTEKGKEFYGKRKSTVEPVFGIIKEILGFWHFMLRGFEAVKGEWTLVCCL